MTISSAAAQLNTALSAPDIPKIVLDPVELNDKVKNLEMSQRLLEKKLTSLELKEKTNASKSNLKGILDSDAIDDLILNSLSKSNTSLRLSNQNLQSGSLNQGIGGLNAMGQLSSSNQNRKVLNNNKIPITLNSIVHPNKRNGKQSINDKISLF